MATDVLLTFGNVAGMNGVSIVPGETPLTLMPGTHKVGYTQHIPIESKGCNMPEIEAHLVQACESLEPFQCPDVSAY